MRIILIHQAFVTTGDAGGTRHIEFARMLAAKGHFITIITSPVSYLTGENKLPGFYLWKTIHYEPNIDIRYCWTTAGMHKGFVHRLIAFFSFMITSFLCALFSGKTDVVWGTSPNLFQGWTAWLSARCKRTKFLLEIRDLWPEFAIAMGQLSDPIKIRCSLWLEKFLYTHADHLIVNSPGFIPHIQKISGKTADLVPNGADPLMFAKSDGGKSFREKLGLNNKFVVMYCGAHGPANDLETVLQAAKRLDSATPIRIVLIGGGKDKPQLEKLAKQLGLKNLSFSPPVSKEEMPDVLAACDAGLAILKPLKMFKTTYPNKVFDIMACGKPVLCQIDGVIREVIEQYHAGVFVQPGDPQALCDAILALSKNSQDCLQMGKNGQTAIQKFFSRESAVEKLEMILIDLTQKNKSA